MDWEDTDNMLINLVKQRGIYRKDSSKSQNEILKMWTEVAHICNYSSVEECQEKWNAIREAYERDEDLPKLYSSGILDFLNQKFTSENVDILKESEILIDNQENTKCETESSSRHKTEPSKPQEIHNETPTTFNLIKVTDTANKKYNQNIIFEIDDDDSSDNKSPEKETSSNKDCHVVEIILNEDTPEEDPEIMSNKYKQTAKRNLRDALKKWQEKRKTKLRDPLQIAQARKLQKQTYIKDLFTKKSRQSDDDSDCDIANTAVNKNRENLEESSKQTVKEIPKASKVMGKERSLSTDDQSEISNKSFYSALGDIVCQLPELKQKQLRLKIGVLIADTEIDMLRNKMPE